MYLKHAYEDFLTTVYYDLGHATSCTFSKMFDLVGSVNRITVTERIKAPFLV